MKPIIVVSACLLLALAACASGPPHGRGGFDRGGSGRGGAEHGGRGGPPDRPREQVFISPAGEPFRAAAGQPYPLAAWWARVDPVGAGSIAQDALTKDFERFFAVLDTDKSGDIDAFEVTAYENKVAPEILAGIGGRPGAAGYGLLFDPEPVRSADTDLDGHVTLDEYRRKALLAFQRLDKNKDGRLERSELPTPAANDPKAARAARQARAGGAPAAGGRGAGRRGGGGRGRRGG
jgi:hypothetical protein